MEEIMSKEKANHDLNEVFGQENVDTSPNENSELNLGSAVLHDVTPIPWSSVIIDRKKKV